MLDFMNLTQEELRKEAEALQQEYSRFMAMGLKLDMSRGKPGPDQLDLSNGLFDMKDYIDDTGVDTRNYGNVEGVPEARRFFAGIAGYAPENTVVGGNSSLHIMYQIVDLGWRLGYDGEKPWSTYDKPKFLCPSPGYDRHFNITEKFGFEMIAVPMTPDGPDMDVVEELVKDEAVKGIWCVPVYSNPDGYVYAAQTVKRLAAMKAAPDFRIVWDNAYRFHHLGDKENSCPNILAECKAAGNENRPFELVSTSKVTFAGGGVAAAYGSEANVKQYVEYISTLTIGSDKPNQLRHVRFLKDQAGLAAHMKKHAAIIRPKFDMVLEILQEELQGGSIATWTKPEGGYFISFFAPEGTAKRIVAMCKDAGVVLTGAGAAFPYKNDPKDSHIRIAPTFPPTAELKTATQLLCLCTKMAYINKILEQNA